MEVSVIFLPVITTQIPHLRPIERGHNIIHILIVKRKDRMLKAFFQPRYTAGCGNHEKSECTFIGQSVPGTGLPSTPIILFIFSTVLVSHFIGGVNQGKEVKEGTQGHTVGGKLECASVPYNSSTPFSTITNTALRKKKKKTVFTLASIHPVLCPCA